MSSQYSFETKIHFPDTPEIWSEICKFQSKKILGIRVEGRRQLPGRISLNIHGCVYNDPWFDNWMEYLIHQLGPRAIEQAILHYHFKNKYGKVYIGPRA